jgi:hypothetical protein
VSKYIKNGQVKEDEIGITCSMNIWENRNEYRLLVGKPEGMRPLRRPRRMWVDNIKINLREIGWITLAQDRELWKPLVNTVMTFPVP